MKIMHWTLSLSAPPLGKTPDIHKITSTYLAVFSEGVSCLVSHTLLSAWIAVSGVRFRGAGTCCIYWSWVVEMVVCMSSVPSLCLHPCFGISTVESSFVMGERVVL